MAPSAKQPQQFLRVVDWESHVNAELRNTRPDGSPKYRLPWAWVRHNTADLDAFGHLTLSEYGAYCRLLSLAAQSDNNVPYRPAWLRRRAGLDRRAIDALTAHGLAKIETASAVARDEEKNQEDQQNATAPSGQQPDSGGTESVLEGEGETEGDQKKRGAPLVDKSLPPAPPQKMNGLDQRSFDSVKELVLELVEKSGTTDPDAIHRFGGQSRRLSLKQCRTAIKQLREDGALQRVLRKGVA